MDSAHGLDGNRYGIDLETPDSMTDTPADSASEATDGAIDDAMFDLGGDERRMHVRAYNHWVSLLKGRPYPSIENLDPSSIADFGPHSVLLDFTQSIEDPAIAYLGRALRDECELDGTIARIADVPSRSLLSRLTDHYLQIIANRAPIGFEAEFIGTRGRTTLYRGILMPFSSNGEEIDYIYGVINWKEVVDAATQAGLDAELDAARAHAPKAASDAPIWADGPSGGFEEADEPVAEDAPLTGSLGDRLMMARESAAAVRASDTRSRSALYRALGRAHDFAIAADADAEGYAELLETAAIKFQPRAPMTPIVKLVFGVDYDKTRITEYAAVLGHARRTGVAAGGLAGFLDGFAGGVKAIVAAERAARRPAETPDLYARAAAELRAMPVLGNIAVPSGDEEFVVLVARTNGDGTVAVLTRIKGAKFVESAVRRAAA